jgi:CTP synthase (UTP-ammonia lyase)
MNPPRVAIIGEFTPTFEPHLATNAAIAHTVVDLKTPIAHDWISSSDITEALLKNYNGIWVAPGSPYKNFDKTLFAIKFAREKAVPCLGTCGGFQHIVIEYARNLLQFKDAQHAEYDPDASELFISRLVCSLVGREMQLKLVSGSQVAQIYETTQAVERYYCNFGVNPKHVDTLKRGAMKVVGSDAEGEIRVLELPGHPFFIATLFVPQALSKPGSPHPVVKAFLTAALRYREMVGG